MASDMANVEWRQQKVVIKQNSKVTSGGSRISKRSSAIGERIQAPKAPRGGIWERHTCASPQEN